MKIVLTAALYCVLAGILATQPRADDIDIYLDQVGTQQGPARVMFALDLMPRGADTVCLDAASATCRSQLGAELYAALDLFGPGDGGTGGSLPARSGDGIPDALQASPHNTAASIADLYWSGVAVERYEVLRAALRVVLQNRAEALRNRPATRGVEVGLMVMHADACAGAGPQFSPDFSVDPPRGCSQGAYVLKGFTDITDTAELQKWFVALAALPDPGRRAPWMAASWSGHPYKIRDAYLELFRYLSGQAVFNGFLGTADYGSRTSGNLYHADSGDVVNDVVFVPAGGGPGRPLLAPAIDTLLPASFDLSNNDVSAARYISPVGPAESCPRVNMVNLQLGAASPSHSDTDDAIAAPVAEGGLGLRLASGVSGDRTLVSRMLTPEALTAGPGQAPIAPVKSYFFHRDVSAISEQMALAGGSGRVYSLADPARMIASLESVFAEVAGGSKSLVAASTLANAAGRSGIGRDLFITLFEPAAGPQWNGNIKKLKLADSSGKNPEIVAQAPLTTTPKPAISAEDGLILTDALTFWTDPQGADVQAFDAERQEVMGRDGRSVTRGGVGQQIRGFLSGDIGSSNSDIGARQVFTLDPDRYGELLPVDATPAIASTLGPLLDPTGQRNKEQTLALIRWIRGQDGFDADGDGDRDESRAWVMADPLHSRPLAISYGARPGSSHTLENPDIRLFFGTNDGLFHVVRNTFPSGAESGQESWAFLPTQMLGRQLQLAQNRVTGQARPYGLDGEAVALISDRGRDGTIDPGEGDTVWVFIGMRRGGKGVLAFDMTNPDKPRYMWAIDNQTAGFEQLALTFSTPRIAHFDLGRSLPVPALVFAGGYNGGWTGGARVGKDSGGESDRVGNAIYVVNPADGSLIWRAVGPEGGAAPVSGEQLQVVAGLEHSIPSPVSLMDSDNNGIDDRGYVGDSGGNLWRIDFTETAYRDPGSNLMGPGNWTLSRLATLGGTGASDRRFFHAPDIVQSRDSDGDYDGVVITSGNRAAPRDTKVDNFAYLVKDRRRAGTDIDTSGSGYSHGQLTDISNTCDAALAIDCSAQDLLSGWKLELGSPGEKGLSSPLVSGGKVFFTSYVPAAPTPIDACAGSQGSSRAYAVSLADGATALPALGKLKLEEEQAEPLQEPGQEQGEPGRYRDIGPGLLGDIVPYGDRVLMPGRGIDDAPLVSVPGRTHWRAWWREEGVDEI